MIPRHHETQFIPWQGLTISAVGQDDPLALKLRINLRQRQDCVYPSRPVPSRRRRDEGVHGSLLNASERSSTDQSNAPV